LRLGIIAAAIWFYIQSDSDTEPTEIEENGGQITIRNPEDNEGTSNDSTDENDEPEETEEEPDEEIEEPEEMQFEVVETGTGSTPESTIALTNPGDELIFLFESEARSWLDVQNGDGE